MYFQYFKSVIITAYEEASIKFLKLCLCFFIVICKKENKKNIKILNVYK